MKFFPVNPEADEKVEKILRQVRQLKDGETAELIEKSGAHYRVNYGVSLVHLRKIGAQLDVDDALAQRLWYRKIRETMIIATMLADYDKMGPEELERWGDMINTIELSEQMGQNFMVKSDVPESVLEEWCKSDHYYKQYTAAMGIGWRIRIDGEAGFEDFHQVLGILKVLTSQPGLHRAVGFALKMAGRFLTSYRRLVLNLAAEWQKSSEPSLKQLGEEVRFEIEAFE
ncbi:DNA alkylation repair protein [Marinilabilia rubra]|uniref:DNA alkylation repair protein n=1 Tax=Marinilabilia rubra TaxID=2162893 RepID=A0A2U2BEH6_9BACT|nr:DNA alkylation repair protein [Marinilabilia rubra]PWE01461.1 hypothetical protein DDZ16_01305 [Marinilabilia rubra]